MNFGRQPAENKLLKLDFFARIIDIDAHQGAISVVIQHNAFEISLLSTLVFSDRSIYRESVSG